MQEILDNILLSKNVVENFHTNYENEEFKNWLLSIMPEVEDCRKQEQDNPWHIYNCMDHILHAVEEINKLSVGLDPSVRKILAYTMFLHDMGKPACHIRRYSKLYKREVDSFFNHNKASVKIADRVLPQLGFSEKEIQVIKLLVEEHDIFMFITPSKDNNKFHKLLTPELVADYIEEYNSIGDGKWLMELLLKVGRADNKAQNPQMTAQSFQLLDEMGKMLNQYIENEKE